MPINRLDKIITGAVAVTKSEASGLIKNGHVSVDGRLVLSCGEKFDTGKVEVSIDGEKVRYREFIYIMLNKPAGYISATTDRYDKTVMELLDGKYQKAGLFPVGRLDKDARGLLLLTNDGDFAHRVASPAGKIQKRYLAQTNGSITEADIEAFASGLVLGDGTKCKPAVLEPAPGGAYVSLWEGKYHQVKRMMVAIGKPVISLTRISIGRLDLDESLKPGECRELYDEAFFVFNEIETKY